ncbi:Spy/CpxP family protein refolding chaperone [Pelagibius marinus]|uniref:Spy/CpxP family protein refolding chaperone n=1 Tax=Pelagibius marinus TaxID=2762760 RepID=UPI001872A9C5|nr:Spy/CpxP family protein refolding chaperone [Pelagibius marinus]
MRSKLPWFLLAASVALNLFFLAGVVFYPHVRDQDHPPRGGDPVAMAAEEFSLDANQVAALEALRERIAERRQEGRENRESFRTIIINALEKPAFDRVALAQALEQRREGFGDRILDMTEDLHGFLAGLAPEQKAAFLARAGEDRDFLRRLLFPPRPPRDRD